MITIRPNRMFIWIRPFRFSADWQLLWQGLRAPGIGQDRDPRGFFAVRAETTFFFFLFFLIICGTYLGVPLFPGIQSNQDPRRTQKPTISIFLHTILGPDYDVPGTPVIQLRGYLDSRAPQDNIIRDLDPFSFRLVFLMYRANRHVPPICKVAIP